MKKIAVTITTEAPVVLTAKNNAAIMTATNDFFSGTMLRGMIAQKYIEERNLSHAELDAGFMSLFFEHLRFVDAYLSEGGRRSYAMPLSLQIKKDKTEILDLLHDEKMAPNFKSLKGFGYVEDGKYYKCEPKKSISLHMSRSDMASAKEEGRERLAGKSVDGGIYNYESVDSNQCFTGYVFGEEEYLDALTKALGCDHWTAYAGRSKYTQYGKCRMELSEMQEVEAEQVPTGNSVILRLETPYIPADFTADAYEALEEVAREMNEATNCKAFAVDVSKIFAKQVEIENFVGVWKMRRPRQQAIERGSAFVLQKDGAWATEDLSALQRILYQGIGQRTEEGFGQLRIWNEKNIKPAERAAATQKAVRIENAEVKKRAEMILKKNLLLEAKRWAKDDAEQAKSTISKNMTHMLSRIDGMLSARENAREVFSNNLKNELLGNGSPMEKHMEKIKIHGKRLNILLNEGLILAENLPYKARLEEKLAASSEIYVALSLAKPKLLDDEIFYVYWHWFFRYARKYSVQKGQGGDNA